MRQKVGHEPRFLFTVDGFYSGIWSLTVFSRTATVCRIVDDAEGFKNLVQTHITSAFLAYREDSLRFRKDGQDAYSIV
jgi:hypothetical protein